MKNILLLDYDHTLYPSTLNTLGAVDDRINLYMRTFLGLTHDEADETRIRLWDQYGTTLRGLEELHGVERGHYCDFIHAIDAEHLPPPDPALQAWLARVPHPLYIFTNARLDWAVRGLTAMGLESMLPGILDIEPGAAAAAGESLLAPGFRGPKLEGIFDIAFMEWEGKPNPRAYAKVDAHLRARHGEDIRIHFADDRPDNLESARARDWKTIWIAPHTASPVNGDEFDRVVSSLVHLDPETLA
jgi:putative hydrolase of the HAD superfamily